MCELLFPPEKIPDGLVARVNRGVKNSNRLPDPAMHNTVQLRPIPLSLVDNQRSRFSLRAAVKRSLPQRQTNVTYEEDVRLGIIA